MSEHPIIFTADSIRAILDGRKTQTRRVLVPQPIPPAWAKRAYSNAAGAWLWYGEDSSGSRVAPTADIGCRYGKPGGVLWVRETWAYYPDDEHVIFREREGQELAAQGVDLRSCWRSPMHLPRRFCRLFLRHEGERAERLQDISEADAAAEGIEARGNSFRDYSLPANVMAFVAAPYSFWSRWDLINAKRGHPWSANEWVRAITFSRIEGRP